MSQHLNKKPSILAKARGKAKALLSNHVGSRQVATHEATDTYTVLFERPSSNRLPKPLKQIWQHTKARVHETIKRRPIDPTFTRCSLSDHPTSSICTSTPTEPFPANCSAPHSDLIPPLRRVPRVSPKSVLGRAGRNWVLFWQREDNENDAATPRTTPLSPRTSPTSDWATTEAGSQVGEEEQAALDAGIPVIRPNSCHTNTDLSCQISVCSPSGSSCVSDLALPSKTPLRPFVSREIQRGQRLEMHIASKASSPMPGVSVRGRYPAQPDDLGTDKSANSRGITRDVVQAQAIVDRPSYAAPPRIVRNWASMSSETSTLNADFAKRGLQQVLNQEPVTSPQRDFSRMSPDSSVDPATPSTDTFQVRRMRPESQLEEDLNNVYHIRDAEEVNADDVFFQQAPRNLHACGQYNPSTLSAPSATPFPPTAPPTQDIRPVRTSTRDGTVETQFSNGLANIRPRQPTWKGQLAPGWRLPSALHNYGAQAAPQWQRDDSDWGNPGWPRSANTTPRSNHLIDQTDFDPSPPSPQGPRIIISNLVHRVEVFAARYDDIRSSIARMLQRQNLIQSRTAELNAELAVLNNEIAAAETKQDTLKTACSDQGIDADRIIADAERKVLEERIRYAEQEQNDMQDVEMDDAGPYASELMGESQHHDPYFTPAVRSTRASEASTIILPVRRARSLPSLDSGIF